jgi:hypothetical protein
MTRSTYPFCQGDRGAVGRSLIPIAVTAITEGLAIGAVTITDEKPWRFIPGESLGDLLSGPLCGRICGDTEVNHLASIVAEDDEHEEDLEG